jgi:hypothetical protein
MDGVMRIKRLDLQDENPDGESRDSPGDQKLFGMLLSSRNTSFVRPIDQKSFCLCQFCDFRFEAYRSSSS